MDEPKDPLPYGVDPGDGAEGAEERPRGRIDKPGFLEEFDEDADFSTDPELEAAIIAGAGGPKPQEPPAETPGEPAATAAAAARGRAPLVRPGKTPDQVWLVAAVVLLLVAVTEALIWPRGARAARVGLTLYGAVLNTGLGMAAIYLAARLVERPLGVFERAGPRVALAACLAQVGAQLQIDLVGSGNRIEELLVAATAYALAMWGLFRWDGRTLGIVLGLHFLGWLALETGAELQSCAAAGAAAAN